MTNGTPRPARKAVVYAPTARKAALPSEIWPVKPVRMFRPVAAITVMAARLATSSQYELAAKGMAKRATMNTASARRARRVSKMPMSLA